MVCRGRGPFSIPPYCLLPGKGEEQQKQEKKTGSMCRKTIHVSK